MTRFSLTFSRRGPGLALLTLTAAVTLLTGCGKKEEASANQKPGPTPVALVTATRTAAVYYDEYPATVVALNTVELRTQVSGFVTGIFFREGELVPKGKLLYEIDRRTYEAAYQQAVANLQATRANAANAQVNLNRYQNLAKQDAIARQIVDNAATNAATAASQVAAAEAAVKAARTNLDFAEVRAPFAGRIGLSQVKLGAQVGAGQTLLNTISSEDPIGVDLNITDKDLPRFVQLQQRGKALPDSTFRLVLPDGSLYKATGRITVVDRGVNQQTGTVTVRVEFPNPDRLLKDGMSGVVRVLNAESGQRIVVPAKAIVEQMGENFVFVATDTVAHQRKVQLGPRLRDEVVVLEGLQEGEAVVTEGLQRLRDGGTIKPGPPAPTAAQTAAQAQQSAAKPAASK